MHDNDGNSLENSFEVDNQSGSNPSDEKNQQLEDKAQELIDKIKDSGNKIQIKEYQNIQKGIETKVKTLQGTLQNNENLSFEDHQTLAKDLKQYDSLVDRIKVLNKKGNNFEQDPRYLADDIDKYREYLESSRLNPKNLFFIRGGYYYARERGVRYFKKNNENFADAAKIVRHEKDVKEYGEYLESSRLNPMNLFFIRRFYYNKIRRYEDRDFAQEIAKYKKDTSKEIETLLKNEHKELTKNQLEKIKECKKNSLSSTIKSFLETKEKIKQAEEEIKDFKKFKEDVNSTLKYHNETLFSRVKSIQAVDIGAEESNKDGLNVASEKNTNIGIKYNFKSHEDTLEAGLILANKYGLDRVELKPPQLNEILKEKYNAQGIAMVKSESSKIKQESSISRESIKEVTEKDIQNINNQIEQETSISESKEKTTSQNLKEDNKNIELDQDKQEILGSNNQPPSNNPTSKEALITPHNNNTNITPITLNIVKNVDEHNETLTNQVNMGKGSQQKSPPKGQSVGLN